MANTGELVIAMSFGDDIRVVTRNTILPMRSNSWLGRFWTRLRAEVVQDVPPSLEECESCREVSCTQERWRTCARRLATEAEQLYARDAVIPSVTGRTAEMPGIFATDGPQDERSEDEPTEGNGHHRAVSSSGD